MITKAYKAKQLIVNFIKDQMLAKGAKLPSQKFLCKKFGFGTATIHAAVNSLAEDGVVDIKDKVGVFVRDVNVAGLLGRTVGITAFYGTAPPYYSVLLRALQMQLIDRGCRPHIFSTSAKLKTRKSFECSINDFTGLRRCIENNELDGLIHLDDFRSCDVNFVNKRKIPMFFIGSSGGTAQNGLFYDQSTALHTICRKIKDLNLKCPALCLHAAMRDGLEKLFMELTENRGIIRSFCVMQDGTDFANEVLAMPADQRPEVIIYFDDIIAQNCTNVLALNLPKEELPRAAFVRNRQLMIEYPVVDPISFYVDLEAVASRAADLLLDAMRTKTNNIGRHFYKLVAK